MEENKVEENVTQNSNEEKVKEEVKYTYKEEPVRTIEYTAPVKEKKKGLPGWLIALIVVLAIALVVGFIGSKISNAVGDVMDLGYSFVSGSSYYSTDSYVDLDYDYIATLYIQDEITSGASGAYNQNYLLQSIDSLILDEENKGIILWIDTPGGTVYATDELYLKLLEYQEETGRPIYASYQNQACSGGYYVSCLADKIIANRNCWTGSIGVTVGSYLDITGLLDNYGIKVNTITSGENKAMGSYLVEMTDEQKAIIQSLVDEAYEQFTGIVADGRNMDIETVIELADGRVYTAKQALENGLIDEIGTYEDAIDELTEYLGYDYIEVVDFEYYEDTLSLSSLISNSNLNSMNKSDIEALLEMNGTIEISYISTLKK